MASHEDHATGELTPGQLEILDIVWAHGEVAVADVHRALQADRPVARNTVQTMMVRLYERGWLRSRSVGNAHVYSAARPRSQVVTSMARRLVDTAFAGSTAGLVAALLDGNKLSAEEAARIRELIAKAERKRR